MSASYAPSRRRVTVVVPAFVLGVCLAGCGGTTSPGGPGSAASANHAAVARGQEAAQATAQTEFGLLAGGDYAGAWDLWTAEAKQTIARNDFVSLNTACPASVGIPTQVASVHVVDDANVEVAWRRGADTGTSRLVYTAGEWRFQPDESTIDSYRRRAEHHCG